MKHHYEVLGLKEGASQQEIQAAYDRLCNELDPAKHNNEEFFVEEYNLVQNAYKALTGKDPKSKEKSTADTDNTFNPIADCESTVRIVKKYRTSDDAQREEILNFLEANRTTNEIYQQAFDLLRKNPHLESFRLTTQTSQEDSHTKIPKPGKKSVSNSNRILYKKFLTIAVLLLMLCFGGSYLYFLKKVEDFKSEIPRIISKSEADQNISKQKWEKIFYENHPEIVNKHINQDTHNGFVFNESERTFNTDTTIQFFLYSKSFPLELYKPDFFECVYNNSVNSDSYWNHYVVGLDKNNITNSPLPIYLEMLERTQEQYGISEKDFEALMLMAGGLDAFHEEKPTAIDLKCKECIEKYQVTYKTNTAAVSDFYNFLDSYFANKYKIDKQNESFLTDYNNTYAKLTAGVNPSLLKNLKIKLEEQSFPLKIKDSLIFNGSENGLGKISYPYERYNSDLSPLRELVAEYLVEYYASNSLKTGATPYSYCYGSNAYCTPPYGYLECSFIDVRAPLRTDVIVIIKKNNRVFSHAYIKAGGYYKFKLGNGSFQAYFYYGNGWNPNKFISKGDCGEITGGFVKNESLNKSDIVRLNNSSVSYTLHTVEGGNFKPEDSNKNEAF